MIEHITMLLFPECYQQNDFKGSCSLTWGKQMQKYIRQKMSCLKLGYPKLR